MAREGRHNGLLGALRARSAVLWRGAAAALLGGLLLAALGYQVARARDGLEDARPRQPDVSQPGHPRASAAGQALGSAASESLGTAASESLAPATTRPVADWAIQVSRLELPEGLPLEAFERELAAAARHWSAPSVPCLPGEWRLEPAVARRTARPEGPVLVAFRRSSWCHEGRCGGTRTFPQWAAAMTTVTQAAAPGSPPRGIIELDARYFSWQVGEGRFGDAARVAPLRALLTHELGHLMGLGDACQPSEPRGQHRSAPASDCSAEERDSVMFQELWHTKPTARDRAQICEQFGALSQRR